MSDNVFHKVLGVKYVDLALFVVGTILLFLNYWIHEPHTYVGLAFFALGFTVWVWGLISLGQSFHILVKSKELITTGIYAKIRNPIYVGSILCFIGATIVSKETAIMGVAIGATSIQVVRGRLEKKKLTKSFGEKYLEYRKKTWL